MSGPKGTVVTINDQSFKGATSVTFEATIFTVDSDTQITATASAERRREKSP